MHKTYPCADGWWNVEAAIADGWSHKYLAAFASCTCSDCAEWWCKCDIWLDGDALVCVGRCKCAWCSKWLIKPVADDGPCVPPVGLVENATNADGNCRLGYGLDVGTPAFWCTADATEWWKGCTWTGSWYSTSFSGIFIELPRARLSLQLFVFCGYVSLLFLSLASANLLWFDLCF